jgi:hypothetical protein
MADPHATQDRVPLRLRWRRLKCRLLGHRYYWFGTFREDFCMRCDYIDWPHD